MRDWGFYISKKFSLIFLTALILGLLIILDQWRLEKTIDGIGIMLFKGGLSVQFSPAEGVLDQWLKSEGDEVVKGETIATLRLLKNPDQIVSIVAASSGRIAEMLKWPGDKVEALGQLAFINLAGPSQDLQLVAFVSSWEGPRITFGNKVKIYPSIIENKAGFLWGQVEKVGKLPISKQALHSLIKIPELAKYIRSQVSAEPFLVTVSPVRDPGHLTGFKWEGQGPKRELDAGLLAHMKVIYREESALKLGWPSLSRFIHGEP